MTLFYRQINTTCIHVFNIRNYSLVLSAGCYELSTYFCLFCDNPPSKFILLHFSIQYASPYIINCLLGRRRKKKCECDVARYPRLKIVPLRRIMVTITKLRSFSAALKRDESQIVPNETRGGLYFQAERDNVCACYMRFLIRERAGNSIKSDFVN